MRTHRRTSRAALFAVCLAAAGALAAGPAAPPALAADGQDAPALISRLRTLYARADAASTAYDAARDRLTAREREVARIDRGVGDREAAVRTARDAIGTLARERYRAGRISPYARLLLADDPTEALSQLRVLGRAQAAQARAVRRARGGEAALARARKRAALALAPVREAAARAEAERDRTADALAGAEDDIASPGRPPAGWAARRPAGPPAGRRQPVRPARYAWARSGSKNHSS